jgi:hypothetical protein
MTTVEHIPFKGHPAIPAKTRQFIDYLSPIAYYLPES